MQQQQPGPPGQDHAGAGLESGLQTAPAADALSASPFAAAEQQAPQRPPVQEMHGTSGSSGGGEADSKAWRQLVEASMQEQLQERQQQQVGHVL